jgi:hypothetical protein
MREDAYANKVAYLNWWQAVAITLVLGAMGCSALHSTSKLRRYSRESFLP